MKKKILLTALVSLFPLTALAATSVPWSRTGTTISPWYSGDTVQLPGLLGKSCLGTDSSGNIQNGTCTGGGGSGGGVVASTTSTVPGRLIDYLINDTDLFNVGGQSTSTAKFIFDPNTQIGFFSSKIGIGTKSPNFSLETNGEASSSKLSGAGLATCNTNTFLTWASSLFGCAPDIQFSTTSAVYWLTTKTTDNLTQGSTNKYDQTVVLTNGTGISNTGTYPNFTITNTAPDQTVAFTNGTGISVTGTYPNFTITNTASSAFSTTSTDYWLTVNRGNAFSTTSADAYINASSTIAHPAGGATGNVIQWDGTKFVSVATSTLGLGGSGGGSVTSVSGSGGTTGLTLTGGPITTSGTLTLGGALVAANGGTGITNPTAAQVLLGSYAGGAWQQLATSSLGIKFSDMVGTVSNAQLANSTISGIALGSSLNALTATNGSLIFSGSYDGSIARTVGLNLANQNVWTAASTTFVGSFNLLTASTSQLTVSSNLYVPSVTCGSNTCIMVANTGAGNGQMTGITSGYGVNQIVYGGSNALNGSSNFTLDGTLLTAKNATTTLMSSSYASSTNGYIGNLNLPNITGTQCLHSVSGLVSGTGSDCGAGGGSAYPFNVATNATTTIVRFNGGMTAQASSTIGDGTQIGGLTIAGGATTTGNVLIGSITASTTFASDIYGHLMTGGNVPTCGANCASVNGDDNVMRVVTGSSVSSATVNFASTWKNSRGNSITPACNAVEESGGTIAVDASSTPTTVVLEFASALTSINIAVQCMGSDNFLF